MKKMHILRKAQKGCRQISDFCVILYLVDVEHKTRK